MTKKKPVLSKRAQRMWARVQGENNWYPAFGQDPGPVMKELVDAGLVATMGRVVLIQRYYVPRGAKPLKRETFPRVKS